MTDLDQKIQDLQRERDDILVEIRPKQDRLRTIFEELRPLEEQAGDLWVKSMKDPDWRTIIKALAGGPRCTRALLRYAETQLRERFDMYHSGYWSDTQEADFKLKVNKNDPESLRKNLEGLKSLTQFFTPHEDGCVWFGLFEHTLSSGGGFTLKVKPDLSELALCTRWNSKTFSTPEEAVTYIQAHHWYGDSDGEDQD